MSSNEPVRISANSTANEDKEFLASALNALRDQLVDCSPQEAIMLSSKIKEFFELLMKLKGAID